MEVSGELHTPEALPPRRKIPLCPLNRRLVRPQSQSGRYGEVKNSWPYRVTNSDPSVLQPVASGYTECTTLAPTTVTEWNRNWKVFCCTLIKIGELRYWGGTIISGCGEAGCRKTTRFNNITKHEGNWGFIQASEKYKIVTLAHRHFVFNDIYTWCMV
jgi:hypothetical protein